MCVLLLVSVGTFPAYVSFHLCRTASVCSCNVLLLLGFGLNPGAIFLLFPFGAALEGDAATNDGIYVISSEIHVVIY